MSATPMEAAGPCPASRSRRTCGPSHTAMSASCAMDEWPQPCTRRDLADEQGLCGNSRYVDGGDTQRERLRREPAPQQIHAATVAWRRCAALLALLVRMGVDEALQRR